MSKGVYLFNKNYGLEHSIQADKLTENYMDANLNGIITGGFTTTDIRDYDQYYYYGVQEDDNFWMYKIRSVVKDNDVIRVHGIHIMYDELQGVVIRDVRPKNKLVSEVLKTILEDTDWTVGTVVVSQKYSGNFYYQSSLQSLYELCERAGCEFRPVIRYSQGKIVSKQIELYDQLSGDYGKMFKYGDNLLKVVAETNTDELYTAFIGRGKGEEIYDENGQATGGYGRKITFKDIDYRNTKEGISVHSAVGQDYIEIKEATAIYGYPTGKPRVCEVSFDDIEDKVELANATFDFALENSRPKIQLKATGLQHEKVDLGETVTVIGQLDIRFKTRVFKIKKDFLQEKVISFEFGDKLVKSTADRIKADQIAEKEREITEQNYIKAMISMVADTYFNEDGYQYNLEAGNDYELPAGIYSFDRPIDDTLNPPTKVIYFGAGKLMIADSKKPDGTWDFSIAMDGEAINANVIRAGILRGGRVEWDLQNGTFKIGGWRNSKGELQNPNLHWDNNTLKLRNVDIDLENHYEIKNLKNGVEQTERIVIQQKKEQGELTNKITNLDTKIENKVRETAESFTREIKSLDTEVGSIREQTENGFRDVVYKNGVISAIEHTNESYRISASKIDLTGNLNLKGTFESKSGQYITKLEHGHLVMYHEQGKSRSGGLIVTETDHSRQIGGSGYGITHDLSLFHEADGFMTLSYRDDIGTDIIPYIIFDKHDKGKSLKTFEPSADIYVNGYSTFKNETSFIEGIYTRGGVKIADSKYRIGLVDNVYEIAPLRNEESLIIKSYKTNTWFKIDFENKITKFL